MTVERRPSQTAFVEPRPESGLGQTARRVMSLLVPGSRPRGVPVIEAGPLHLRAPEPDDFPAWADLREKSRGFLVPWEPVWPSDDLTRAAFRRRLKRYAEDERTDQAYTFFVFRSSDAALMGGLSIANMRRGVAQSASLGYWMGAPHAGQGHMTAAVRALLPFVFATLRLHRLEAACLPSNGASIRLLEKVGFQREGYARRYLCINGAWQDHLLYALLKDDVQV
jgi:ribosomal-protein-alanine N-acetyltransferase